MLKVNELFAGIGAIRRALIALNVPHEVVGISEIDKYAIKSYEAIYGPARNYGDISKVDKLDYADLWVYGFPCQDISVAGQGKGIVKGETRSGLLYEVQRLLQVAQESNELPGYLILENVKNLISKKHRDDFESWMAWLDSIGYNTYWDVMDARDYGIPQHRERVFAVSIRKDIDRGYQFPKGIPLTFRLKDILKDEVEEKYFLDKKWHFSTENDIKHDTNEIAQLDNWKFKTTGTITDVNKICRTLDTMGGGLREPKVLVPAIQKIEIPQIVRIRRHEVDIEGLKLLLREAKARLKFSNKEIAEKLNVPITMAEHWFRQDEFFSIPDDNIWLNLKSLLEIDTDEFDKSILEFEEKEGVYEKNNRIYSPEGVSPTITCDSSVNIIRKENPIPKLMGGIGEKNFGKQYRQGNRVYDANEVAMALGAAPIGNAGGNSYLYAIEKPIRLGGLFDDAKGKHQAGSIWDTEGLAPTIDTCQGGYRQPLIVDSKTNSVAWKQKSEKGYRECVLPINEPIALDEQNKCVRKDGCVGTLTTDGSSPKHNNRVIEPSLKLRKLTPEECWLLQGFSSEDFQKARPTNSDTQLYKQAGNSIYTGCLIAILYSLIYKKTEGWDKYLVVKGEK